MPRALRISPRDNVAVALEDIRQGDVVEVIGQEEKITVKAIQDIPKGHKIALTDIKRGGYVYKYGEVIGIAIRDIRTGEHVHVHNIDSLRGKAP